MRHLVPIHVTTLGACISVTSALFIFAGFAAFASQPWEGNDPNAEYTVELGRSMIARSAALAVSMLSGYSDVTNNILRIRCAGQNKSCHVFFFAVETDKDVEEVGTTLAEVTIHWRNRGNDSFAVSECTIHSVTAPLRPAFSKDKADESIDRPIAASVGLLGHNDDLSDDFFLSWKTYLQGDAAILVQHYPFKPGRHVIVSISEQGAKVSYGR